MTLLEIANELLEKYRYAEQSLIDEATWGEKREQAEAELTEEIRGYQAAIQRETDVWSWERCTICQLIRTNLKPIDPATIDLEHARMLLQCIHASLLADKEIPTIPSSKEAVRLEYLKSFQHIISYDSGGPVSITHLQCGMTSHNRADISARYCGHCHMFLDEQDRRALPCDSCKTPSTDLLECDRCGRFVCPACRQHREPWVGRYWICNRCKAAQPSAQPSA